MALVWACTRDADHAPRAVDTPAPSEHANADAAPAGAPNGATYVGLRHGDLPDGVTLLGGSVIPSRDGTPSLLSFTHVSTPRGDMIWLDSATSSGRNPTKVVTAELIIPPVARDERLFMASCDVRGAYDARIIAIAIDEPRVVRYTKIRQAWRAFGRRFEILPVAGVSCEDPDRGPE
jgi:hypothetical protein